ncbi:MAG: SCO family protein [Alcanivorax sp.]|nr:SCO family protein [Alcanivorax sp.]
MSDRLLPLLLAALLPLCLPAAGARAETREARTLNSVGVDQRVGERVPLDLKLRDRQGRTVTLGQLLDGRPALLELAWYDCPNLCDLSLRRLGSQLSDVKYRPDRDYRVITVSLDPHEGPADAAHAAAMLDESYQGPATGSPWHVLTGDRDAIRRLAAAIGFRYQYDADTDQYAHPAGLAVLDRGGRIASYLLGLTFSGHDLQLALTRAGDGELGSFVDQIALRCFHFDPEKGAYTLDVLRVLNLACLVTAVALALGVGTLLWRRRRRGPDPEHQEDP